MGQIFDEFTAIDIKLQHHQETQRAHDSDCLINPKKCFESCNYKAQEYPHCPLPGVDVQEEEHERYAREEKLPDTLHLSPVTGQ
jgi:hypothetical protein